MKNPTTSTCLQTTEEAAKTTGGYEPQTWRRWRMIGKGPKFVRIGRRVFYRQADIEEWLAANTYRSTSDPGTGPKEPA